jgi:hypothetical protein
MIIYCFATLKSQRIYKEYNIEYSYSFYYDKKWYNFEVNKKSKK